MNIKRDLKYYWLQLKMQVQGGYKEVKRIFEGVNIIEDIKAVLKRFDEEEAYEKEQKRIRKIPLLKAGDVVEFRQPDCPGNIIKAKVLGIDYIPVIGCQEVLVEILETGLRQDNKMFYYQHAIMTNLVKLEHAE